MYNYISKIGNISFGIFVGIALLTMLILTAYGGLMPDVLSKESDLRINFDVPMYFFNSTDRNRSYVKITYDKNNVDTTFGALEVSFTSSQNKPVGVKTSDIDIPADHSIGIPDSGSAFTPYKVTSATYTSNAVFASVKGAVAAYNHFTGGGAHE